MKNDSQETGQRLRSPLEGQASVPFDLRAAVPAPLELHRCNVKVEWVDYNQHMSESCYLLVFGDSSDAFFRYAGIDEAYRAQGLSLYTAETYIRNLREVGLGEPLRLTLRLLDFDHKRLHIAHAMYHADRKTLLATAEQILVHVDMNAGKSTPFPMDLRARFEVIHRAHAQAPGDDTVNTLLSIERRGSASTV
ncbi:thioesterase family protein [Paraburkholderia fungorum]|uniref:thioesterase family protein n=1 Tax=Paraburkholderia fungorum TaxID=134537 RepID=UPI0038B9BE8A